MSIQTGGFYVKVLTLDEMTELFALSNILPQHALAASSTVPNGERPSSPANPDHLPQPTAFSPRAQFIEDTFERVAACPTIIHCR